MGVAHVTLRVIATWISKFLERHRSQFVSYFIFYFIFKKILYSFILYGWGEVNANVPQLSRSEGSSKELILSLHHLNQAQGIRLGGRKADPLDHLPT